MQTQALQKRKEKLGFPLPQWKFQGATLQAAFTFVSFFFKPIGSLSGIYVSLHFTYKKSTKCIRTYIYTHIIIPMDPAWLNTVKRIHVFVWIHPCFPPPPPSWLRDAWLLHQPPSMPLRYPPGDRSSKKGDPFCKYSGIIGIYSGWYSGL